MKIAKLLKVGTSLAAVVPAAYRRELGWLQGDYVQLEIKGKTLVLKGLRENAVKTRKGSSSRGANELSKATAGLRTLRS